MLTSRANLVPNTCYLPPPHNSPERTISLHPSNHNRKNPEHTFTTTKKFLKSQEPGPTSKPNQDLISNNYAQG